MCSLCSLCKTSQGALVKSGLGLVFLDDYDLRWFSIACVIGALQGLASERLLACKEHHPAGLLLKDITGLLACGSGELLDGPV